MKKLLSILLLIISCSAYSQSGNSKSMFGGEMAEIMEHMKLYTLAIADQMPDDKYDFRPVNNDTVRTFAEQLKHLVYTNNNQADNLLLANTFDGFQFIKEMEEYQKKKMTKVEIINALSKSFDKLIARLKNMTGSDFDKQYTLPFITTPKSLRVMAMFIRDHISHHRAQLIVYLRMNGIEPAFYKPF